MKVLLDCVQCCVLGWAGLTLHFIRNRNGGRTTLLIAPGEKKNSWRDLENLILFFLLILSSLPLFVPLFLFPLPCTLFSFTSVYSLFTKPPSWDKFAFCYLSSYLFSLLFSPHLLLFSSRSFFLLLLSPHFLFAVLFCAFPPFFYSFSSIFFLWPLLFSSPLLYSFFLSHFSRYILCFFVSSSIVLCLPSFPPRPLHLLFLYSAPFFFFLIPIFLSSLIMIGD